MDINRGTFYKEVGMNRLRLVILCISIISFLLSALDAAPIKKKRYSKQPMPRYLPVRPANSDKTSWWVKSGFFVGAGIGAGMMLFSTPNINNGANCNGSSDCGAKDLVLALDYTARIGYQHYLSLRQGVRLYASYTGGSGFPTGAGDTTLSYMNKSADFNIDFLLVIVQTKKQAIEAVLGAHAGYSEFYRSQEGSYMTLTEGTDSLGGLMAGINVGVGYTFMIHHRFDVTVRIPLLSLYNVAGIYRGDIYKDPSPNNNNFTKDIYYRYTSVNVSYNFIF